MDRAMDLCEKLISLTMRLHVTCTTKKLNVNTASPKVTTIGIGIYMMSNAATEMIITVFSTDVQRNFSSSLAVATEPNTPKIYIRYI